jgi:hypothetical protein
VCDVIISGHSLLRLDSLPASCDALLLLQDGLFPALRPFVCDVIIASADKAFFDLIVFLRPMMRSFSCSRMISPPSGGGFLALPPPTDSVCASSPSGDEEKSSDFLSPSMRSAIRHYARYVRPGRRRGRVSAAMWHIILKNGFLHDVRCWDRLDDIMINNSRSSSGWCQNLSRLMSGKES